VCCRLGDAFQHDCLGFSSNVNGCYLTHYNNAPRLSLVLIVQAVFRDVTGRVWYVNMVVT